MIFVKLYDVALYNEDGDSNTSLDTSTPPFGYLNTPLRLSQHLPSE
jgi:hypothetical protein